MSFIGKAEGRQAASQVRKLLHLVVANPFPEPRKRCEEDIALQCRHCNLRNAEAPVRHATASAETLAPASAFGAQCGRQT